MCLSALYLDYVLFYFSADIFFMAFVERGTGACFHMIWQPASLLQFVNFIRKVYVLMVIGAGKISTNSNFKVAVGWESYIAHILCGRFVISSVQGLFLFQI